MNDPSGQACDYNRPDPVHPLIQLWPNADIERTPPRHVGTQSPAEAFDPAIFRLGNFAADEIG